MSILSDHVRAAAVDTACRPLPRRFATAVTTMLVLAAGVGLSAALVWAEIEQGRVPVDWPMFAVMAILLVLGEVSPRCWIMSTDAGLVTPRWLFSFSLLLLGSPAFALAVSLTGAALNSFVRREPSRQAIIRLGGSAATLAGAGLLLRSLGVGGAITQFDHVSWEWGGVILLAGVAILLLNTFVTAFDDAVRRNMPLTVTLRRGLGTRLTAEGALVSLAPIWVIGIDFSLVLVPLLVVTTVLVFRSTRQALEQAHEARHDPLTGLLNRRAFRDELRDSFGGMGASGAGAVLLMDLDGFKEINDRLGHEVGDRLLVAFADRLMHTIPDGSLVARLGGDEFAALLPLERETSEGAGIDAVAMTIHDELSVPLVIEDFPVTVGVSIGLALAPHHGRSASDLLRAADIAMYKAKRCGTSVERYDTCVQAPQRGRIGLLSELAGALESHQLEVHFQPQLRLADGAVDTVEALIRWQHPEHGTIPPNDFIGLAEQTDLIGPITDLVLRLAVNGVLWAGDESVKVAVNVSARSLHDRYFAPHVFTVLDESGFPPSRLELEVTERALVTNPERSTYTIERLREAGVRIAIDDFGSGYSSYQILRQLDVDRVKIDREFVTDLVRNERDRAIVHSVTALAHQLQLDVVAEGVESIEVWDALGEIGCDLAQGFVIARPMPFAELRGWVTRWNELHVDELVH